jgi:predicted amino acid dehydrogenase
MTVGLGGLTKVHGYDFALYQRFAGRIHIATGNRLTAVFQAEHVRRVTRLHGWNPVETRVVIAGVTGSVGRGVAILLADTFPLTFLSRTASELEALRAIFPDRHDIHLATNLKEAQPGARIVLILTTELKVQADDIQPGIHYIDAAREHAIPMRLFPQLGEAWIDGGATVEIDDAMDAWLTHVEPGRFNLPSGHLLPCLAEAIVLAGRHDGHFGIEPPSLRDSQRWREIGLDIAEAASFHWSDPIWLNAYFVRLRLELSYVKRLSQLAAIKLASQRVYHEKIFNL